MSKKNQYIFFFFFFVVYGLFANIDTLRTGNKFELTPDNPVLSQIDSIMAAGYFESLGFSDEMPKSAKFRYAVDSVPEFDTDTYIRRFKKLQSSSPIKFTYNAHVKAYINLYAKRRKKITAKMLGLVPVYFPVFEEQLDKYGLPLELKYLAIVESALNPKAKSGVGATGLWQFMYETGKMYGLNVSSYHDDRSDLYKSTDAACRYLRDLHKMYNNWDLALAAYNCGPGNVNKAIRRSGGKTEFWEIMNFLPRETNGYVPAFMAVAYVMTYAAEHNIQAINPSISCLKVDTVHVQQRLTFNQISQALDIPIEYLEYINPTYKQNIIPGTIKANTLCLPYDKIGLFVTNEEQFYTQTMPDKAQEKDKIPDLSINVEPQRNESVVYKVKSGDGLSKIAQKYNCRTSQIKEWNNLKSDRLHVGQTLYLYPKASSATQQKMQEVKNAEMTANKSTSDGKFVYYTVKSGDTFYKIAAKFEGTSVDDIIKLNKGLDPRNLKQGAKIKIKPVG